MLSLLYFGYQQCKKIALDACTEAYKICRSPSLCFCLNRKSMLADCQVWSVSCDKDSLIHFQSLNSYHLYNLDSVHFQILFRKDRDVFGNFYFMAPSTHTQDADEKFKNHDLFSKVAKSSGFWTNLQIYWIASSSEDIT